MAGATAGGSSTFDYFLPISTREMPKIRLFCFPHAGGSASTFSHWPSKLTNKIDIVAIAPPGRGSRMHEPLPVGIKTMASDIADGMKTQSDVPFAFFGHSFGTLVAYEVARELEARGEPTPVLLIASAHEAPHLSGQSHGYPSTWLHGLPDEEFINQALLNGFIPEEALGNTELLNILTPVLRADLRLNEIYEHSDPQILLSCPVVAFGGADDLITPDDLEAWAAVSVTVTTAPPRLFSGGHFYHDSNDAALPAMEAELLAVMATLPLSILDGGTKLKYTTGTTTAKLCHVAFDEQAHRTPDAIAIVDVHRQLTYKKLRLESDLLARQIQQMGVGKGSIVGSYMPHRAEYMIANLAIFKAGGAVFPLETNYPSDLLAELAYMASISVVLTIGEMRDMLPADLRTDEHSVCLDGDWYDRLTDLDLPELYDHKVALSDPAYVTMTSGSTGRPKGVLNTHIGATCNFMARFELIPYHPGEREALNVFFVWECLRPVMQGATAYIIPDDVIFDPKKLVNFIAEHQITRLMTTTQLVEAILEYPGLNVASKLQSIRCWLLEGEPVPARVVNKWLTDVGEDHGLYNCYSTWESLDLSYSLLDQEITSSKFAPVGRPISNVIIYLMTGEGDEPNSREIVPTGCPGEIYVESPGLAMKYMGDPLKTAERFLTLDVTTVDGKAKTVRLYRTGDRGRILPTGELECMGRMDSTVKIRGFKVSIPFVESTIKDHPRVATAAVMPLMDTTTNIATALAAYIVGKDGLMSETHLQEVKEDLQSALPSFAYPQHWIMLENLPTKAGESRKLDRQALPAVATTPAGPSASQAKGAAAKAASRLEEVILECWSAVLNLPANTLSTSDNFFEVGGHSLFAAKLVGALGSKYGVNASVLDIYDCPTIATLARHLGPADTDAAADSEDAETPRRRQRQADATSDIAIIGMAGRFPGANSIDEFWSNLQQGHDSLRPFTDEELVSCGVPPEVRNHPDFVPAGQVCDDVDKFDAAFWGIGKLEAEVMDPQHRVFMETAWHAIESAGYAPRSETLVQCGVFAASGIDGYLIHHLNGGALKNPLEPGDLFMTEVGSEKDYMPTRVSYALNLQGPSMAVNSACSSGLVAVAQAAQSISVGACDMAIAGASSLTFPNTGFLWEENLVYSRDGHVRPFDQGAAGTTFGDSVGAIVLKVLDDAVEDGDNILAVLSGSAVTNDGGHKAGYTAPAAAGQRAAIVAAHKAAGVAARDISYVECHATATNIGDAIELRGLTDAFAQSIDATEPGTKQFCAIGSVKGNIGHANCAAGLTGLMKTVLCLQHRQLVPTAHFTKLSDKISIRPDSPFYIHEGLTHWIPDGDRIRGPLTAGVSSFGIGGTNAHAVLREWTPEQRNTQLERGGDGRAVHVLTASAKSPASLKAVLNKLADHIINEATDLTDCAFTLHAGREEFPYRAAVVCDAADRATASEALRSHREVTKCKTNPGVVMCFPGQGSQYVNMGRGLYKTEAVFRQYFDQCCELLQPIIGCDLRAKIFTEAETAEFAEAFNSEPEVVQTSIFAVEYALAKFLIESTGVKPIAMVGHSIGEYAAAAVSGLMSLKDALGMVATRAKAMHTSCNRGAMLSAKMPVEAACAFAAERSGVWLACENSPENVAFSCSPESVEAVTAELSERGYKAFALKVTHGFHSAMVQPAADAVEAYAQNVSMSVPEVPMTSNVSGGWLTDDDLTPERWAQHIVGTVRFVDNIEAVSQWQPTVFLEVGPGTGLCSLIKKCIIPGDDAPVCIPAMRHPKDTKTTDEHALATTIARLWSLGNKLDWAAYHKGERALRAPLPGYSFEKSSFWKHPEQSIYLATPTKKAAKKKKTKSKRAELQPASANLVRYGDLQSASATMKVYCFPYAGGSSSAFAKWARECPQWMEVVAIELPGRGSASDEPLSASHADDIALVRELAGQIRDDFQASRSADSIAMVGLSMGVLMALEVQQLLADLPIVHSFLAGRAPVRKSSQVALDQTTIDSLNLAPPEVTESEAWKTHFLPMLMADLAADSRAASRLAAIEKPAATRGDIDVFCGLEDPSFPPETADQWRRLAVSDGNFDLHFFFGGHEFLKTCAEKIFGRIQAALAVQATAAETAATVHAAVHSHSEMLSSVVWEHASLAAVVPSPDSQKLCVLSLGASEVHITDEHVSALNSDAGLVVMLADGSPCDTHGTSWVQEDEAQCWRLLQLVNRLAERGAGGRLVLVCDASVRGAMAAGASKTIPLEMPELFCQRVFVKDDEAGSNTPTTAAAVLTQAVYAARRYPSETDILVEFDKRQRRRSAAPAVRVARLQPFPLERMLPAATPADGVFVRKACYIITGGLGGVGLALVDWLIDTQQVEPSNIVVLSRRKYTGRVARPRPGGLRRDVMSRSLGKGATGPRGTQVVQADVSSRASLLANDALRQLGDVAGIFHLAGVLDDGLIGSMDPQRIKKTVAPKAAGAMNLVSLAEQAGWDVEFMLSFSSTSSLGGYAGQANYCSANAVLDHLGQGWQLPSSSTSDDNTSSVPGSMKFVTVNFGPWGEVGMAVEGTRAHQLSLESGQTPMSNEAGMRCIGSALKHALSLPDLALQFAVCQCDWPATPWYGMPLLSHCAASAAGADAEEVEDDSGGDDDGTADEDDKTASGGEEIDTAVVEFMRARVPGKWDINETLSELGMDSLDTVQLRNQFNKQFSPSVPAKMALFTNPSTKLGDLVRVLEKALA